MTDRSSKVRTLDLPLNRVEGDLEIRVEIDDGVVVDAWSTAPLFRGFEGLLRGRDALDALVVTPRICGMCSVSHLVAAAEALGSIAGSVVPDHAQRLRNIVLMSEHVQNDMRQTFLMYAVDLVHPAYAALPGFEEALRRYEPFKGTVALEVLEESRLLLEMVALLSGQWPHSSFIVPGGVAVKPGSAELVQSKLLLTRFRTWYERRILGCSLNRWQAVRSAADLDAWLDECEAHRESEVGFFLRYGRTLGLDQMGRGHGHFISVASLPLPGGTGHLVPAGFVSSQGGFEPFEESQILEHVAYSWYQDYEGGRPPLSVEAVPFATGEGGRKYTWSKAPRYNGLPPETGTLAEAVVSRDPLFVDLLRIAGGPNALLRQLARLLRTASFLRHMETWLAELINEPGSYYEKGITIEEGRGVGLIEAARGVLGHWVQVEKGRIVRYQVMTPTSWNGSPRDSAGVRGPWEEALIGTPVSDPANPVEVGHVVRSFDPCMVCCVHVHRRREVAP